MMTRRTTGSLTILILALAAMTAYAEKKELQVFILAGQSNMEGHGKTEMGRNPETGKGEVKGGLGCLRRYVGENEAKYGAKGELPLLDKDGKWIVRDDVWIYTTTSGKKKGRLTSGFGAGSWFGPEFGFGHIVGNKIDDPVLIIKTAWGGKSLGVDFRPPSAKNPDYKHKPEAVGHYYREMMEIVKKSLKEFATDFPELKDCKPHLAGFGWHQGWNDGCSKEMTAEYEKNLVKFIKDVRKDLKAKNLPFVVANSGMVGMEAKGIRLDLCNMQMAVGDPEKHPEFAGTVASVDTRPFDRKAEESPSNFGYHWKHNGVSHWLVGESMGKAMLELLKDD